ncbi:hypothetical protein BJV78DRAFT_1154801 [Lactifluus subvellereus]|nr:hypothetical protein BJV78DRAFT_1154801 [Lactifluus subvellereus]
MSLQREFDEENLALVAERDQVVRDAERTFACNMCYRTHPEDSVTRMSPCSHEFCPDCLRTHVIWELKDTISRCCAPLPAVGFLAHFLILTLVTNAMVLELGITDDEYAVWVELEMSPISVRAFCVRGLPRRGRAAYCVLLELVTMSGANYARRLSPLASHNNPATAELRERLRQERTQHEQWHQSLSIGAVSTVSDLRRKTGELANEAALISAQTEGFAVTVPNFRDALKRTIRISADSAILSVVRLGDAVTQLSAHRTTIARTRARWPVLALASDLGVEITSWRSRTESCVRGVEECRTLAGHFSDAAEMQVALSPQERIATASGDCESATVTRTYEESAQDRSRGYKRAATIRSALVLAQNVLDDYRARLGDGVNTAFDVSVFFGGLVACTAAWDVIASASTLAEAVVKLQRLLDANTHLTGVFITSPSVLNNPLSQLADSNIPADELSALT